MCGLEVAVNQPKSRGGGRAPLNCNRFLVESDAKESDENEAKQVQ